MNFGNLTLNITANIKGLSTKLTQASSQVNSFAASMRGATAITENLNKQTMEYGFNLGSVKRIVSGIVIAQVFYKALGAIQDSTVAVFEFANSLEYAQTAYSNLFGSVELAEEFINVLKDFAATTPFDFEQSEAAAKRLLAYGVEYSNVMYVMQGVLAAASMQGDSSKVESISRALGQIYTKGRLMNQEMNQLTEAGIPAWEILQEKIGLTADQIGNIGNAGIPASVAINALVDGMQERFGDVITASSRTLTGIISNIKDNALMIGAEVVQPLVGQIKAVADAFGQLLYNLRNVMDTKGIGGLFEALVPESAQNTIRTFIANLMNLWTVVKYYLAAAFEAFKSILYGVIIAFNTLAPFITIAADILGRLIYAVASNSTAMRWLTAILISAATAFLIFKASALGLMALTAVYKVIMLVSGALQVLAMTLMSNPILLLFGAIAVGLVGLSVAAGGAANSIANFFKSLTSLSGADPDSILLPESEERAAGLEKFNKKLDDTKDSLESADDATKKLNDSTNKLKKGLLSFDEVFRLNDNDKGTTSPDSVADTGLDDYDLSSGLGDTGAWIPEIPDMSGFGTDFVDGLIEALKNAFGLKGIDVTDVISMGIGAAIGAVAGGLLGGPVGMAIGALAGAIVGFIWAKIADVLGMSDNQKIATPIGAGIGAAIGGLLGGPMGALIGAAIGGLAANIIALIVDGLTTGNWDFSQLGATVGMGIGAAIGGVLGGPMGAVIGAAIGNLVGNLSGMLLEGFINGKWDTKGIGRVIGSMIGAGIGFVIGGPGGALIGAAIGGLVGYIGTSLIEAITSGNWDSPVVSLAIGGGIGAAIGAIVGGPPGALIGAAIGGLIGWLVGKFKTASWSDIWNGIKEGLFGSEGLWSFTAQLFTSAGEFFAKAKQAFKEKDWKSVGLNIIKGILQGIVGAYSFIIEPIVKFFSFVWDKFCELFGIHSPATKMEPIGKNILLGVLEGIIGAIASVPEYIGEAGMAIIEAIGGWFVGIGTKVATWLSGGITSVVSFVTTTGSKIRTWASTAGTTIATWASKAGSKITSWASTATSKISSWASTGISKFTSFSTDTASKLVTWSKNAITTLSSWATDAGTYIATWVKDAKTNISDWATKTGNKIASWVKDAKTYTSDWASKTGAKIASWVKDAKTNVSDWASNTGTSISTWATDAAKDIKDWWEDVSGKFKNLKDTSFTTWATNSLRTLKNWAEDVWSNIKTNFNNAIDKIKQFLNLTDKTGTNPNVNGSKDTGSSPPIGHATGGVFNREHYARFAEGNKAEAIIPLENDTAMRPFVDAVANGLVSTLAPMFAGNNTQEQLQPLYVGTLIADDRGLKELERKMNVIRLQENKRR